MDSATAPHDLIARVRERVRDLESLEPGERDVSAVDLIDEMESLKNAAAAAQARASHLLKQSRVAERAHLPAPMRDRGVATEVALARRESPHRGSIHLGLAGVLVRELPHTLAAMEAGRCSEWRAIQIAQGTACLSLEDRQQIDAELMADPTTTEGWGERRFRAEVDRRAYTADPSAALARHRKAAGERQTSLRPAPDGMVRFSALLPLSVGVSVHATLSRAADEARAAGDERTRGQVMADVFTARVLHGRTDDDEGPVTPVAVQVTLSDATLLNLAGKLGDEPGWVSAPGVAPIPLPADLVRDLVARAQADGEATLRRLYVRPEDGQLVAMESTARCFPAGLAAFLTVRDRSCRTPGCDAPIRHRDHVVPVARGGPTSASNGQGLCEGCNQAKEAEDFRTWVVDAELHDLVLETPSGHRYRCVIPKLPPPQEHSFAAHLDESLTRLLRRSA
ncbi:HNH endonuclease signature motif containing protein [uncultured Nocardioides sp.]|uniref:HNH endonuclease n=1 Tax=uncultured Nocardioides sp. TaxID=198441 RepID=UPI002607BB2F|nr:HNH endonuclease signature motif containing protein [uncultured Nocardioides sp.]